MKIASFFAGIGGIDIGFRAADKDYTTIYINDIDQYALQALRANISNISHSDNIIIDNSDIRDIDPDNIPDCDIITGGFPCQAFSVAGNRHGFCDPRGTLFFDLLRIIRSKKPKIVFLENVRGLVSHDNGNTFRVILSSLAKEGYHAKWQVLNARDFNLPQNRPRIFIVAFADYAKYSRFEFPKSQKLEKKLSDCVDFNGIKPEKYYLQKNDTKLYKVVAEQMTDPLTLYRYSHRAVRGNKKYCYCLLASQGGGKTPIMLTQCGRHRKITPHEAYNLQGYPQHYILPPEISDAQHYKLCGNSVAIPVIRAIAAQIKRAL